MGLEEYCSPDDEHQRDNIYIRCTRPEFTPPLGDKNEAVRALGGLVKTDVPVWDMMARILAALNRHADWQLERRELGTVSATHRTTQLTELRPLPRPGVGKFRGTYMEEWFAREFRNNREYERLTEAATAKRVEQLLKSASPPELVLGYGKPVRSWCERRLSHLFRSGLRPQGCAIVGTTGSGTVIALTGFYNGQHAPTAFREGHIEELVDVVEAERTGG